MYKVYVRYLTMIGALCYCANDMRLKCCICFFGKFIIHTAVFFCVCERMKIVLATAYERFFFQFILFHFLHMIFERKNYLWVFLIYISRLHMYQFSCVMGLSLSLSFIHFITICIHTLPDYISNSYSRRPSIKPKSHITTQLMNK